MNPRALLHSDPRFALATWRARAVYQLALDYQDAAGDFVAAPGRSIVETLAVAAHCTPVDAADAVVEMRVAGLVDVHPDRLELLVCSNRGRRGGKSAAERKRDQRARDRARDASRVTGHGESRVTVTANVTGNVTGESADNARQSAEGHGSVTFGAVTSVEGTGSPPGLPPPALPPSPSVSLSLSPLPSPSPPPATGPIAGAREDGPAGLTLSAPDPAAKPKRQRPKPAPAADVDPPEGSAARAVRDAIVADPGLRPITGNPGDWALRATAPGAFPGVDVLAEVLAAGEYVARGLRAYSDGRAFLSGWMRRRAAEIARQPKPAPAPPGSRASPRGFQPAATAADFERSRGGAPADPTKPIHFDWRTKRAVNHE
jgi:hypothetical protein